MPTKDTDNSAIIGCTSKKILMDAGVGIRKKAKVHDTFIQTRANYGGTVQFKVITGSHNFTHPANYSNDELFVRTGNATADAQALSDAYWKHWQNMWDAGEALGASECDP